MIGTGGATPVAEARAWDHLWSHQEACRTSCECDSGRDPQEGGEEVVAVHDYQGWLYYSLATAAGCWRDLAGFTLHPWRHGFGSGEEVSVLLKQWRR